MRRGRLQLHGNMKKSATVPKTVLATILDWSQERPVWQHDALRRIVSKGRLDAADLAEADRFLQARQGR
jgi:hypothetical protein